MRRDGAQTGAAAQVRAQSARRWRGWLVIGALALFTGLGSTCPAHVAAEEGISQGSAAAWDALVNCPLLASLQR